MPFQTALSGIRAASNDLSVTGNNIANASTTGFKDSRVEFGDVYATSVLGAGSNAIGSGVKIQDIAQRFTQGSVSFTENELDLAINGNGFFVVEADGEVLYTRSGAFGLDQEGYIVNNSGARLQGYAADLAGNLDQIRGDIQIETSNLAPRQTTLVESLLNLDSTQAVLQSTGKSLVTDGNSVAVAEAGLKEARTTTLLSNNFVLDDVDDLDFNTPVTFQVQLSGASANNGTVSITLDVDSGVPATVDSFNDLRTVAAVINAQIFSPAIPEQPIDVTATAVDNGDGTYSLAFTAVNEGESSQIAILNPSADAGVLGLSTALTSNDGVEAVSNGYPAQSVDITDPDGDTVTFTTQEGDSAADIAAGLNSLQGVSATAETQLELSNYNTAGNATLFLNGVALSSDTLTSLATEINALTNSTLPGISAEIDRETGTSLFVTSSVGDDLEIELMSTDDGDFITVLGNEGAPAQTLETDPSGDGVTNGYISAEDNAVFVGGRLTIVLEEGYTMGNESPRAVGIFQPLNNNDDYGNEDINEFDPGDAGTYNSATSMNVYDSLGNSHILTQYFVKQEYDPEDPTTAANHWKMYVQIDGEDVGIPDTEVSATEPTQASYNVYFNDDGSLDDVRTDRIIISNWVPKNENGELNGAMGPSALVGDDAITEPPTSSNFEIELDGTTQFSEEFSVNDVDQDGYSTGRLSGLSIDESGVIFARFTNGESQILGQIVLADFANQQGLQPVGDTMWAENYESGPPNIGTPSSAALGAIQSSALEESNVDLSEQLVNLIIAQRNFQASAKTIETADQVTQTIINLR